MHQKVKNVFKFVGKRIRIILPILLLSNVAFAAEGINDCENLKSASEIAARSAEAAKKVERVKKLRATSLLAAASSSICGKAFKEYAVNTKSRKIGILMLTCGLVTGWVANNLKNAG